MRRRSRSAPTSSPSAPHRAPALIERLVAAKAAGDLAPHADPDSLAKWLTAIMQGMAVQAGAGASREDLEQVIETSLQLWPSR